jgi:hypothetical protein
MLLGNATTEMLKVISKRFSHPGALRAWIKQRVQDRRITDPEFAKALEDATSEENLKHNPEILRIMSAIDTGEFDEDIITLCTYFI